jgi:hypothetical protein
VRCVHQTAEEVRELRRALFLTQRQFAQALGVSRRTVIRGEQRGLEVPWFSASNTGRHDLHERWCALQAQAADRAARRRADGVIVSPVSGRSLARPRAGATYPAIAGKVSPPAARDTSAIAKVSRRRPGRHP